MIFSLFAIVRKYMTSITYILQVHSNTYLEALYIKHPIIIERIAQCSEDSGRSKEEDLSFKNCCDHWG